MSSAVLDWLPYVDPSLTETEYEAAKALVTADLKSHESATATMIHPQMRDALELKPTSVGADLIQRASRGEKLAAIDMTRYEGDALEPPLSASNDPDHLKQWAASIDKAATLYSYLTMRGQNLALLETFGKNAWLIGNDNLETELKSLEKTLAEVKERLEQTETQRRTNQENSKSEIDTLQDEWRQRLAAKLKTEVATAELNEALSSLKQA